jgi:hypothetical protein
VAKLALTFIVRGSGQVMNIAHLLLLSAGSLPNEISRLMRHQAVEEKDNA